MAVISPDFSPAEALSWATYETQFDELLAESVTAANADSWLRRWSDLSYEVDEIGQRVYVASTCDTTDERVEQLYKQYLDEIYPPFQAAQQKLKEKFLAANIEVPGFEVPLRNIRTEAEIFREENLPLELEEQKLGMEFDKVIGAQTVSWDGKEVTPQRMGLEQLGVDRDRRERAWRATIDRTLEDREALNELWTKMLENRLRQSENAGFGRDYRAYRWKQTQRFDYSPDDCRRFAEAIEKEVVPAMVRIREARRQKLGLDSLRPWDLEVDPDQRPALRPFEKVEELDSKCSAMFHAVSPELGSYYETMRREGLLDLDNRKGKAPGGYCTAFMKAKRPFIFMNAVGTHRDVQTLLHEGGHAFHVFESASLPYAHQLNVPTEFAEVASMGMELLAGDFLGQDSGGFYSPEDAQRARTDHYRKNILFWPYMAVVDQFQHWVYENPDDALDSANCDREWSNLWDRFMKGEDWSGLEDAKATGWHRKLHIFQVPLYYVEYGLAQLGAVQVWRNALQDRQAALAKYRRALSLGGSVTLPQLFETAGAKFAFDADTVRSAVELLESKMA